MPLERQHRFWLTPNSHLTFLLVMYRGDERAMRGAADRKAWGARINQHATVRLTPIIQGGPQEAMDVLLHLLHKELVKNR